MYEVIDVENRPLGDVVSAGEVIFRSADGQGCILKAAEALRQQGLAQ